MNSLGFERRFEARKEIHREVTGLTAERIRELWEAAGGPENRDDEPGPLSTEDRLAAVRRNELKRIWSLMTRVGWETYSPESDPEVARLDQVWRARQERESGEAAGPVPEAVRYRIVARRTDPAHPGAAVVTHYAYGRSVEEAVAKARAELEKPGGVYGGQGLYRVVEVAEESLFSGVRQQEDAHRRYLTTILDNALTTVRGREPANPDADHLSLLDDFFTRAVVFPDPHGSGVHPRPHQATFGWTSEPPFIEHASDPGRALAIFLLAYLDHHGLALAQAARSSRTVDAQATAAATHALLLLAGDQDPGVAEALEALAGRAWDAYGIALHHTGAADENGPKATMEAMRHAVQAVARGFAAATLARVADDPALDLTLDQRHYLDTLAAEIDLDTIEALHGTTDLPDEAANVAPHVEDRRSEGQRSAQRDADEGSEAPPELIEQVSDLCEQHFAAVTGTSSHPWEAESRELVGIALRTVRLAERDAYPQVLEDYLNANRARLERLWARYGRGGLFADEVVLVDFPACCVLCERLDTVPLWLEGVWAQEGQEATALERLHDAWLYDTRDKDGGR